VYHIQYISSTNKMLSIFFTNKPQIVPEVSRDITCGLAAQCTVLNESIVQQLVFNKTTAKPF